MLGAELYLRAEAVFQRMITAAGVVHQAVWLGLLRADQLDRATMIHYSKSDMYAAENHNSYGLYDWEQAAISGHFTGCKTLLIGGAGGGREALALSRQGFEVTAFECSAELLRRGRQLVVQQGATVRYLSAAPNRVPKFLEGRFDGAIMGWAALSHIAGSENRIGILRSLAGHLSRGAPLLVSFLPRSTRRRDKWVAGLANGISWLQGRGRRRVEAGDNLMLCFQHLFTEEELTREFQAAGFSMVHYSDQPYGHAIGRLMS